MTAAWKCCALALVLFASLAAGQTAPALNTLTKQTTASPGPSTDYVPYEPADPTDAAPTTPGGDVPVPDTGGATGGVPAPADPAAEGNNTMDPLVSGCRNAYHVLIADVTACNARCADKLVKADGQATIAPEVYDSKVSGTCCNCNFERTPGIINPTYIPADGAPAVPSPSPLPPPIDPSINLPPSVDELIQVTDPAFVIVPDPGQINTYVVLRVTGGPFTLPLPFEQTLGFVYAFDNVTGVPWQIKGVEPSVAADPPVYPAAPAGVPQVRNGPPPLPPPPATPAPVPPATAPAAPVVDPATGLPVAAPTVDPAAGVPVASPTVDPATGLPVASPAVRRRQLRSISRLNQGRRMMQDVSPSPGGDANYDFSPLPGSGPDYEGNGDYNSPPSGDYESPSPYGESPSPPNDYGNDNSPSPGADYGDENSSPEIGDISPSPVVSAVASPPPFMPIAIVSPPPPVGSPPPTFVIPTPGPPVELPANMDGIWVFAVLPLTDAEFASMAQQLNEATGDGNGAFLKWLQVSGVPVVSVELRYIGQATEGQIDLTKRLDGDIFGAATTAAAIKPPPAKMSTTTIAAIVGGVVGGVLLIAIAGVLIATNRRKNSKAMKESLTQRWRTERELVEAEKAKIENSNSGNGFYTSSGSRRYSAAHDSGLVAVTGAELSQQRSSRRAAIMAEEAKLSSMQLGIEATPSPTKKESKPSRLDGMRAALGLGKKTAVAKSSGSASSVSAPLAPAPFVASESPVSPPQPRGWTVEGSGSGSGSAGGQSPGASPYSRHSLRAQYSSGRPAPSPRGSGGGSQDMDANPSPWGRMFTK